MCVWCENGDTGLLDKDKENAWTNFKYFHNKQKASWKLFVWVNEILYDIFVFDNHWCDNAFKMKVFISEKIFTISAPLTKYFIEVEKVIYIWQGMCLNIELCNFFPEQEHFGIVVFFFSGRSIFFPWKWPSNVISIQSIIPASIVKRFHLRWSAQIDTRINKYICFYSFYLTVYDEIKDYWLNLVKFND